MNTPCRIEKRGKCRIYSGLALGGDCALSNEPTTWGEHIVHIDGVTGSSPVATTKIPGRKTWDTFLYLLNSTFQQICRYGILIAKNNGSVAAKYVEYNCLFIKGKGQVVGTGWGYLTDDDSELKPGMTEFREESCYETFKKVELYFTGRS